MSGDDANDFQPGQVIAGQYRLVRPIGRGGMASVWEVVDQRRNETLAIKFLASAMIASEEAQARFEREVEAVSRVESPFVIRVMDFGVADSAQPYMVLERLEGRDLDVVLTETPVLGLEEVECIVRHVCGALATARAAGVIHRDIKPANIFVTGQGIGTIAKVLDFGIARIEGDQEHARKLTRPDEILGTLEYISPEQLLGQGPVDGRADLYGLGVVAYRCLTGRVPYPGDTLGELLMSITRVKAPAPSTLVPGLPPSIDEWMARALAQDRTARFQTPEEMADRLVMAVRSFRAQMPATTAPPVVSSPPGTRTAPTSPPSANATTAPPPSTRGQPTSPPSARAVLPNRAELPSWVDRAEAPDSSWHAPAAGDRPARDPALLPSRTALRLGRALSSLERAAPEWMKPILRSRGRSTGATLAAMGEQFLRSFRESLADHPAIWLGVAVIAGVIVLLAVLFVVLG